MPSRTKKREMTSAQKHLPLFPVVACGLVLCLLAMFGPGFLSETQPNAIIPPDSVATGNGGNESRGEQDAKSYPSLLGTARTVSLSDDDNRENNITLAAEAINGYVLKPGEVFSFNEVVGNVEDDDRYKEALAIQDDEYKPEQGGGICQVSSTLYMAAISAGLDIIERHPHAIAPDYTEIGLDATISYGSLDLKIENNEKYDLIIYAKTDGQIVNVDIYSEEADITDRDTTYEPYSEVIEYSDIEDSDARPNEVLCTVASYRVHLTDGVRATKDLLSKDTYRVTLATDHEALPLTWRLSK